MGSISKLQNFEIVGDRAEYRPTGDVSLPEMVQLVGSALVFAREQQIEKLLVVTSGLTGFKPPLTVDRYYFIQEWAEVSGHIVSTAVVARPEMINFRKFGVTVAFNNGFIADIFASEDEGPGLAFRTLSETAIFSKVRDAAFIALCRWAAFAADFGRLRLGKPDELHLPSGACP